VVFSFRLARRELGATFPPEFQGVRIVRMTGRALVGHRRPPLVAGPRIAPLGSEVNDMPICPARYRAPESALIPPRERWGDDGSMLGCLLALGAAVRDWADHPPCQTGVTDCAKSRLILTNGA